MDLEARHSLLREKLDKLGFTQPLPIGSLAIVSALLDDLILTTNSLKDAKKQIRKLNEEKSAWELGVEPYKCDNSKLLAECNNLHLEIIKQRDVFNEKIHSLNKTIRNLKLDNQYLEEQCAEQNKRIIDLESQSGDPKFKKNRNDQTNQKRKPFLSTVPSGVFLPPAHKASDTKNDLTSCCCSCHSMQNDYATLNLERERNNVKTQLELVELYKSQLDSRNREISRLSNLLIGGRPPVALAKDCCYRGVGSLTEDIVSLQQQKAKLQTELDKTVQNLHEAMERAMHLQSKYEEVTKELHELKEVALSVETEANSSLNNLHKRNIELKARLEEYKQIILELESKVKKMKQQNENTSEKLTNGKALKQAQLEIQILHEKLELSMERENHLNKEIDKLTKKNTKLKSKYSLVAKADVTQNVDTCDIGTMTIPMPTKATFNECPFDIKQLKIDRDFYQQEYIKLASRPKTDTDTDLLRSQLNEKELELKLLRQQLQSANHDCRRSETAIANHCVQSAVARLQRENSVLQQTIDRLTNERNELRNNIHLTSSTHRDQVTHYERELEHFTQRIHHLESELRGLQSIQAPSKSTISMLKQEISELREQITELREENSKQRMLYNQLKIQHQQAESTLAECQNRLTNSARQLTHAESRLNSVDSNRNQACQEIGELKAEINRLKILNTFLEKEKDQLVVELDSKTEKLFNLETKMDSAKTLIMELESQVVTTSRQLDNVSSEKKKSDGSLQHASNEIETFRRQINQLKRANDNAMAENSRLANELADSDCTHCLTKTKLAESEKEVERLKNQLQQYVQEVQRAEELLMCKEKEREEMLDNYRTLSQDAVMLEGNNHSLELEAAETKRNLSEAEDRLERLQNQLIDREKELNACKDKVCELTKEVNQLELDVERYKYERNTARKELEAIKELCSKLDIEKEKLNAEVLEYSEIRRELERENEKLRNELLMSKSGDNATVTSLQQLLTACRKEAEDQRLMTSQANKEISKLQARIEELQDKLSKEHGEAVRNETLAKEYSIQIQELRNRMIDNRFELIQNKGDASTDRFSSV